MKCGDFQELIEDYHDGNLDQELAASIQLHLGGCPECAEAFARMQAEDRLYHGYRGVLESEIDVTPAMWGRIRAGIEPHRIERHELDTRSPEERSPARWIPFVRSTPLVRQIGFAALLVTLSVAGTLFVVRFQGGNPQNARLQQPGASGMPRPGNTSEREEPIKAVAGDTSNEKSLEAALRAIQRAERDYLEAIQVLSDIVDKRKPTLQVELVRELDRNLKAIDERIEAARKAYHAHISDPYLAQSMLTAYSRKVELLQEVAS